MKDRFHIRNRYFFFIDIASIIISVVLSYFLRLEVSQVYFDYVPTILWMLLTALLIKLFVFHRFRLYSRFWASAGMRDALTIALAVTLSSGLLGIVMFALSQFQVFQYFSRSVLIIDWMFSLILIGGIRFFPRITAEISLFSRDQDDVSQVLIVGAGDAGGLMAREMQKNPVLKLRP
ncbi:MAG: hypothetical protein N2D54_06585, partial [Chloroflexota bacterium]